MTQTATTPTRDTAAEDPVPRRLWRVAGGLALAHVVLLFTGLSLQNAALFQEGRAGIESSYVDGNLTRSVTGGYIELIGFVLMIPVIVLLARGLGRRTAAGRWAAQTALVGGIGYLVLTFSPGMAAGAVSMHAAQNGVGLDTAWVMNNLRVVTYVVSLMFLGVHAIGVGIAALSDRFSPRLVGIGGLLSGKRLQLELGGKGANVVFADADLDAAVNGAAFGIFHNQGQACIAGSRLLLHDAVADEFLEHFLALAGSIRVGDPLAPGTEMGPLTSPEHRDRVLSYVKVAEDEGGEVLLGGAAPSDPALAAGCYVLPTVVRADPSARVCQEEVFGPFVTVSRFADDDEAFALANGTDYGLGGSVWTRDLSRAHWAAAAFRTGMVWVNCTKRVGPGSPFGGVGQSGYGREMGFEAMRGYTEPKSVWVNVDAAIPAWYPRS